MTFICEQKKLYLFIFTQKYLFWSLPLKVATFNDDFFCCKWIENLAYERVFTGLWEFAHKSIQLLSCKWYERTGYIHGAYSKVVKGLKLERFEPGNRLKASRRQWPCKNLTKDQEFLSNNMVWWMINWTDETWIHQMINKQKITDLTHVMQCRCLNVFR